jgi:hypothetical protein
MGMDRKRLHHCQVNYSSCKRVDLNVRLHLPSKPPCLRFQVFLFTAIRCLGTGAVRSPECIPCEFVPVRLAHTK